MKSEKEKLAAKTVEQLKAAAKRLGGKLVTPDGKAKTKVQLINTIVMKQRLAGKSMGGNTKPTATKAKTAKVKLDALKTKAKKLGYQIVKTRPGLVPLETKQKYPKLLEGLTLKNIRLKFSDGKRQIMSEIGELIFTSFGISGPLVLTLSGQIVDWLGEFKNVFVEIDLKPALTEDQLDARLLREFKTNSKKTLKNTLKSLLPQKLISVFFEIAKINPEKKVSQVTQQERQNLASLLKGLRLDILKSRPIEEAMVTRGGVYLKDIDPRTMESRLIKGLYFAGEMIDIDADTGGFNLQAAFSTGYLAGESAALSILDSS
jgi:predicted Rossmann fold flavoprotein